MNTSLQNYLTDKSRIVIPTESPLDRIMSVTFFNDQFAMKKSEDNCTLRSLVDQIRNTIGASKAALPWLKLAKFGEITSRKGSLRNDENLIEIHGIEADYDGEHVSLWHAERVLRAASLAAVIYTSPSHTEDRPRWRVLCPTSAPVQPADRAALVARVNGLFVGALASESFTLSQSYYFGHVEGATQHRVIVVEGRAIDLASDLDAGAMGKPVKVHAPAPYSPPQPSTYVSRPDGCSPYGLAGLERECANITNAPDGDKHQALNKAAYSIGGLVAGGELDAATARNALANALETIKPRCKDFSSARRTANSAFDDGFAKPRGAPAPPETSDIPLSPLHYKLMQRTPAKPIAATPDIMDVGGVLGAFVDHCNRTAMSPQPLLALAAGICLIGVLAGRKYRTSTDLRTNVYTVGVADSGAGKDHARKQLKLALKAAGLTQYLGGEDIASGAAILTALERHPAQLFQIDEFGDWLNDVIGQKAAPHKKQISQRLKTLYSSAGTFVSGTEYADQSRNGRPRADIQQPHACLYGTTTPGQLWSAVAGASLSDGLLARILLFVSPCSYPEEAEPSLDPIPQGLVEALQSIHRGPFQGITGNLATVMQEANPEPLTVRNTADADTAWRAMRAEQLTKQRENEGTYKTAIWGRLAENAIKLALIRAISNNPQAPEIEYADVKWGLTVAAFCIETLLQEAERHVGDTDFERTLNKAREIVRKFGPVTGRDLFRRGFKVPEKQRDEILAALVTGGDVIRLEPAQTAAGGRPAIKWAWAGAEALSRDC